MYVKLNENSVPMEWPVNKDRIKLDNPNVSFPSNMSNLNVSLYGFGNYQVSARPSFDEEFEVAQEITPVLTNGVWVQTWQVVDKYTSEEKVNYIVERDARIAEDNTEANTARRNNLLSETDWWTLSDTPEITAEQIAYRQALRDITSHANFPNLEDADWPTKP